MFKKNKAKPIDKSKVKPKKKKYVRPYKKSPVQVKQAYIMPTLLVVGMLSVGSGFVISGHNTHVYNQQVMASSMTKGTELVSWGRDTQAGLTMGETKLSKDGKTLAVEIKYDETAHTVLSSFGKNYALRLITPKDNPMTGVTMNYGLFGTDGSGVLTIHNDKGFQDKAFVVMLVDKERLVTSDDLSSTTTYSDSDIDDSITAQLSGSQDDTQSAVSDDKQDKANAKQPAIYYVRLNGARAHKTSENWSNDRDIVNDLFVNQTLAKRKQDMSDLRNKMKQTNKTIAEMDERLKKNPDDTIAQNNKTALTSSLTSFQTQYDSSEKSYNKIKDSTIKTNVLQPKVKTYERIISDLSALNN